ncbi:MAG: histidine kinase [Parvibaculum sp.]|nr:histidine kinase [Parvibaculum sp.]|tara:strand:- start:2000 stop:3481 length:1482 start_codon:yes stop_codon:yes gene_type:complete
MDPEISDVSDADKQVGPRFTPAPVARLVAPLRRNLSAQLLVLTVLFVMLAEVLIYVPSLSNFRDSWIKQRLAQAQIATLALEATPDNMVANTLRDELLTNAEAFAIVLHRNAARRLILRDDMPPAIDATYDLRDATFFDIIMDMFDGLMAEDGRTIRVIGKPRFEGGDFIEIVFDETPLRQAMLDFSTNILNLSILISIITASLVFFALNFFLVRPMRRITENMVAFSEKPDDASRVIEPSARLDEIGVAERELADLQTQVRSTLNQQARLASLGTAISKINHDLRNILASTQLISDRLGSVDDPTVQSLAPRLFASIDRAIQLCTNTLKFGSSEEAPPARRAVALKDLATEAMEAIGLEDGSAVSIRIDVAEGLEVDADPDHLFRVFLNLGRNAAQAMEGGGEISVSAFNDVESVTIELADTGPGIPDAARERLFQPFGGTTRQGGTGLGLAISADLVRAHGGTLELVETGAEGTRFRIWIPHRKDVVRAAQ